jgi:hypothetical protein
LKRSFQHDRPIALLLMIRFSKFRRGDHPGPVRRLRGYLGFLSPVDTAGPYINSLEIELTSPAKSPLAPLFQIPPKAGLPLAKGGQEGFTVEAALTLK